MSLEQQLVIEENFSKAFNTESLRESLKPEDFEVYNNALKILEFSKGDVVFEDGDSPKGVYFIEKGTAKLSKSGVYGKDQILRFCKEAKFRKEIFELLGVTYQFKNFKAFIEPLLKHDYLELTVPDKPTSPKQQYRTTKKGLLFLETI